MSRLETLLGSHATRLAFTIALFFILLAASVGVNIYMTQHAIDRANVASQLAAANKQYQHALCDAGNVSRAQQIQLWQFIVKISPAQTTAQKQRVAEFETYLHAIFAPRNCNKL